MPSKTAPPYSERRDRAIAYYHRAKYRLRPGSLHVGPGNRGRLSLYDRDERLALGFLRVLDAAWESAHRQAIRRLTCRKCGNDRVVNPDTDGRCCACLAQRRPAKRRRRIARLRQSGLWTEAHRSSKNARRAKIANAPGSGVTPAQWGAVLDLYGHSCLKCGSQPVTMDHVVPLSRGGHHDPSNVQPLCHLCNSTKGATVADYRPCAFVPHA